MKTPRKLVNDILYKVWGHQLVDLEALILADRAEVRKEVVEKCREIVKAELGVGEELTADLRRERMEKRFDAIAEGGGSE